MPTDIYAMLAGDVHGPAAGHVVLLTAADDTLTRVEALTASAGAIVTMNCSPHLPVR